MKVIDLLNTPLDKLPKKIKIEDRIYNLFIDEDTNYHYYQDDKCKYFMLSISCFEELNEEVEIIEEDKKIEKLIIGKDDVAWCEGNMKTDEEMVDIVLEIKDKINEMIDKINNMEVK